MASIVHSGGTFTTWIHDCIVDGAIIAVARDRELFWFSQKVSSACLLVPSKVGSACLQCIYFKVGNRQSFQLRLIPTFCGDGNSNVVVEADAFPSIQSKAIVELELSDEDSVHVWQNIPN